MKMAKTIGSLNEKANTDLNDEVVIEQPSPNANFKTTVSGIAYRAKRERTVIVNDISDLPAPVSGVITLEASTEYRFSGAFDFGTDRIVANNGVIIDGIGNQQTSFTYTGTDPFISGVDVTCTIMSVTISCVNALAFDFDSSVSGQGNILLELVVINGAAGAISVNSISAMQLVRCTFLAITGASAVTFAGTLLGLAVEACAFSNSTFTGAWIDFGTATFTSTCNFDTVILGIGNGQFGISGLVSGGNFTTGLLTATIVNFDTSGTGVALQNINQNDNTSLFFANSGVPDSTTLGSMSIENNATLTTITTANVPVKAAGTWIAGPLSRFTFATNTLTFTGARALENMAVTASGTISSSGNNRTIGHMIYRNGVEVAGTRSTTELDGGDKGRVTSSWIIPVVDPNDTFEIFLVNENHTSDVLLEDGTVIIRM